MTCLIKISTGRIIETIHLYKDFGKLSMLNIAELDLEQGEKIYNYVIQRDSVIVLSGYENYTMKLECIMIKGLDEIISIKKFFGMDTYYSNVDYNFIELIQSHIDIEYYSDIAYSIISVSKDYKFLVDMLRESLRDCLNDLILLRLQTNHVENIVGIVNLVQLEEKFSQISNYDSNILCIIGKYLDIDEYKEYLENIHPQLYRIII